MAVLNGLTPRFEILIVALDELQIEDKLFNIHYGKSQLLQEGQRFETQGDKSNKARYAPDFLSECDDSSHSLSSGRR